MDDKAIRAAALQAAAVIVQRLVSTASTDEYVAKRTETLADMFVKYIDTGIMPKEPPNNAYG